MAENYTSLQELREAEPVAMAARDPLTGLLNRPGFQKELERHLHPARRAGGSGALLFIDIDNFKDVNDCFGHPAGDSLLRRWARCLESAGAGRGVVGRVGGDEFAILLPGASLAEACREAQELLGRIQHHHIPGGEDIIELTLSIGIAAYPSHGTTADDLLLQADLAMHEAKNAGGNRCTVYSPHLAVKREIDERVRWLRRIRHALDTDAFRLYRQPIVHVGTGRVAYYELLLRLAEPDGRVIGPGEFLPIAARSSLMVDIDRWVVDRALTSVWEARRMGITQPFSINLSAKAFTSPRFIAALEDLLRRSPVDPADVVFEITEQTAVADVAQAQEHMVRLQAMGCRFALDDFGVGYAGFDLVKRLPVDFIKIDGSFIRELPDSLVDRQLLRVMVDAARVLGKQTIAEFVETPETANLLKGFRVDFAQGYHLGRPEPMGAAESMPPPGPRPGRCPGVP